MTIKESTIEKYLRQYGEQLITLGNRFKTRDEEGEIVYDFSHATTPKDKRRIVLMWIGEIIHTLLDDLQDPQSAADFGDKAFSPTSSMTKSLINSLAWELLDLF